MDSTIKLTDNGCSICLTIGVRLLRLPLPNHRKHDFRHIEDGYHHCRSQRSLRSKKNAILRRAASVDLLNVTQPAEVWVSTDATPELIHRFLLEIVSVCNTCSTNNNRLPCRYDEFRAAQSTKPRTTWCCLFTRFHIINMRQKITFKAQMDCEVCRYKALKIATNVRGVSSVSLEGNEKELLAVTGEDVDIVCLAKMLKKKLRLVTLLRVEEVKPKKVDQGKDRDKDKASVLPSNPCLMCQSPKTHDFPQRERAEIFDFFRNETVKLFGPPLIGSTFRDEKRKSLLRKLRRRRDFIRLLLSYPVRTVHDGKLKAWSHEASRKKHSLEELNRLLNENPFKFFEGLLPMEILENVEEGWSSIFADNYVIPEAILNLAANLAVDQLVQTLLSEDDHVRDIHHVLLSTRDGAEKKLVTGKIESVLKDKEIMVRLHEIFLGVLMINASNYQSQVEVSVRQQIVQQLQLPMVEGNDDLLKIRIEEEMSTKKYLVLLVDGDANEPLDPRKVGFSEEELAGVVVLITTESVKPAKDELALAIDLSIRTKDHFLPWEVFCRNVDNEFLRSSNTIQTIAARIVEECGSHLLAIVTVANSLKDGNHVKYWEDAVIKLCSLHPSYDISMFHGQSGIMFKAFINFIWCDISERHKHCLTSCLFIPEIKYGKLEIDLINDWISSGLVDVGEAKHCLRELIDRFVLLQFKDTKSRYIQIPEDTYAIVQSLNTQNPFFIKKSGLALVEPPNSQPWHSVVYIDLADNKLSELPLAPNCLELKALKLQNNFDLTAIPPLFFFKMPILRVLDLSYTSIRELPSSFFELEQLRELYMKGCERFMKLSSEVGKLKNLEKLDLDKTQIIHLPKEVQELTNLQSLNLCFYEYRSKKSNQYTSSTILPPGVISKLKELKHLSIGVNPDDERWQQNVQVILPEILALECLQKVSLYIPEPELLNLMPANIFKLDFRFVVGQHMSRIISSTPSLVEENFKQSERSLKFVKGVGVPCEIKDAIRHTKALFLDRHMTAKDLSVFGMMNIKQIRVCILAECKEMKTIVDGRCSSSEDIFPHLLLLSVHYMKNLRSICEGQVRSSHCFGMLKSLALHNCPKLTSIFTLDFVGNLSLLKVLVVKDCPKISSVITCGSFELVEVGNFLPKLRTMLFLHLPELITISKGLQMGPNLERIGIYNCPKLQSLSKSELSSQNLKVIKGEVKWWEALKWSEAEWGTEGRPSQFDCIFSSINQEADIMTQLGLDDGIDDSPGGNVGEPLDASSEIFKDTKPNAIDEETSTSVVTSEKQMRNQKTRRVSGSAKEGARGASGHCNGQRCQKAGCNKSAKGRTAYCKGHGGGRRCQYLGCTKTAETKTDYCVAHGGGRRCSVGGCTKAARGKSGLCIRHGGGKRCKFEWRVKVAEGSTDFCNAHGGGKRFSWGKCDKFAMSKSGLCAAPSSLIAPAASCSSRSVVSDCAVIDSIVKSAD
ncbi:uncharacterized protein LOC129285668 [Prosopis cineraria]|uniref:uncharacterized protein LOC129285668 n=1 Tax=Prosopis cineraria TaxID=364024 RepID=UPI00240EF5F1|nr:uncharacterized protein LOC129285668 [Prosopis cineraria]